MENVHLALLREAKIGHSVALTEFYSHYKLEKEFSYAFFEGKSDRHFYYPKIMVVMPNSNLQDYYCGGKTEVLKAFKIINGNIAYNNVKIGYYIDSDFEDNINNQFIYETPVHSVENFYLPETVLNRFLDECFDMHSHGDKSICLEIYNIALQSFYTRLIKLNAWLACHSDLRIKGIYADLKIDDTLKPIFSNIVSSLIVANYFTEISEFHLIEKLFSNRDVMPDEFETKVLMFQGMINLKHIRGKFSIKFLFSFLKSLSKYLEDKTISSCSKSYSCKFKLEEVTMMIQLSNYAYIPPCLKSYFKKIYG